MNTRPRGRYVSKHINNIGLTKHWRMSEDYIKMLEYTLCCTKKCNADCLTLCELRALLIGF